jgi:RHS repeat-associated protein
VFRRILHLLSLCIAACALLFAAPAAAGQHPLGKSVQPAAPALSAFSFDENSIKGEKASIAEYTYRARLVAPRLHLGKVPAPMRSARWQWLREDYGFTGKEADVEVGLTYFGKRYLVPSTGRWLSPDPLALHVPGKADLNLYAYVRGRVFTSVDPWGLQDADAGAPQDAGTDMPIAGPPSAKNPGEPNTKTDKSQWVGEVTIVGHVPPMEKLTVAARQQIRWEAGRAGIANAGIQMANAVISLMQGPHVPKEGRLEIPQFDVPKAEGIQGDILNDHYSHGLGTGHTFIMGASMAAGPLAETAAQLRLPSVIAAGEASGGGSGMVTLFHGTTNSGAQSILQDGLLPVSTNTGAFPAGSFFTHVGGDAQVAASHWAARSAPLHGGSPVLLQGTMPQALFNSLSSQGLIRTSATPGLPFFPPQTVILPDAFGAVNGAIQWSPAKLVF